MAAKFPTAPAQAALTAADIKSVEIFPPVIRGQKRKLVELTLTGGVLPNAQPTASWMEGPVVVKAMQVNLQHCDECPDPFVV